MGSNSVVVTVTPYVADGRVRVEIEGALQTLGDAWRMFFPSSPALPDPAMEAPQSQRPQHITAANGKAPQASTNGGKQKLTEKSCAWCGNLFRGRPERKYHSAACQAKAKQHRKIEKTAEKNGQAATA